MSVDPGAIKSIWEDFLFTFFLKLFLSGPLYSDGEVFFQLINEKWCSLNGQIFFLGQLLTSLYELNTTKIEASKARMLQQQLA